ncbi:MAG: 3-oxoadipate enol-lactonase [Acidobacteriota bacterium]|nr:3-oxoadipate enol-lactonase [Acidobacteriota bacterium]
MPYADLAEVRLHYRFDGPEDRPVLVLSHSLGTDMTMWYDALPALAEQYRILRYDMRGHGKSSVPPGLYTVANLGSDVLALLDDLGLQRCFFCGLSLGGMIGIWLGANAPERMDKMILANTAARIGTCETWNLRIERVLTDGMESVADEVLERWFTPQFREASAARVEAMRTTLTAMSAEGYARCCEAIRDMDLTASLHCIQTPSLVVAGTFDVATPPSAGRFLAMSMQQASYVELPAAHISAVEQADEFSRAALKFLGGQES